MVIAGGILFWPTIDLLVRYWASQDDYSHAFLIPVVSVALVFRARSRLSVQGRPSWGGLVCVGIALAGFLYGAHIGIHTIQRAAMWAALAGACWFVLGWPTLRRLSFPVLFLLLAIPLPSLYLTTLRLELKEVATQLSAEALVTAGYPAVQDGNVLVVAGRRFEVVDACSGIRSLMALTTAAVFLAYVLRAGLGKGATLVLSAVPVTVFVNVVRIIVIAVAAVSWDVDLVAEPAHTIIGVTVAVSGFLILWGLLGLLDWVFRRDADADDDDAIVVRP